LVCLRRDERRDGSLANKYASDHHSSAAEEEGRALTDGGNGTFRTETGKAQGQTLQGRGIVEMETREKETKISQALMSREGVTERMMH